MDCIALTHDVTFDWDAFDYWFGEYEELRDVQTARAER